MDDGHGTRLRVAVILSTTHDDRGGPLARWITGRAEARPGLDLDIIDLAEAHLPEAPGTDTGPRPLAVRDLAPWLTAADAFVLLTPERNRSFPASLKNAIDWYPEEWRAKPVAFVSYGDTGRGLRAADHLRSVLAGLEAVTIASSVCLDTARDLTEAGRITDPERTGPELDQLLDEVIWWAGALRRARVRT
jgi:NAD(P)H-dependent FMN reductase